MKHFLFKSVLVASLLSGVSFSALGAKSNADCSQRNQTSLLARTNPPVRVAKNPIAQQSRPMTGKAVR